MTPERQLDERDAMSAAMALCGMIPQASLPHEILVLEAGIISVVADIGGIDFILTVMRVPIQRRRPEAN